MADSDSLRAAVCAANLALVDFGLVHLTWGNVSGIDRAHGVMWIKASGVPYAGMGPEHMVAVAVQTGDPLPDLTGSSLKPSSDTATHCALYRAWPDIGGIVHTHSAYATAAAQAGLDLPAQGTTHADHFHGDIPCARALTQAEVEGAYEAETGRVVIETFSQRGIDPLAVPSVLVNQHGPFSWGASPAKAVENASVLEFLAKMRVHTAALNPNAGRVPHYLLDRHYLRKHGPGATYGQG